MYRTQHRVLPMIAAALAALTLGAAPALAGSDGCVGGDCQDENTPIQPLPATPVPVAPTQPVVPQPPAVPAQPDTQQGGVAPKHASKAPKRKTTVRTRTVAQRTAVRETAVQVATPQGGVAAGAGGTAPQGPDGTLLGLAGGALALLITGGGVLVAGRRAES
jgi:hypothetical protein